MEQQSDHKLMDSIWDGVVSLWGRVAPLLCSRGSAPTRVNSSEPVRLAQDSCIRWHSDNESLLGPQNSPKLIVCMSLGHSVEFQVRRAARGVPSPIQLDHGDLLVMFGLAQSEYEHRTASGLQGPRVDLTYRWIAQHITSCPLAGEMCCTFPSCARFSRAGSSRGGNRGNKISFFWGDGPPFLDLGCAFVGSTLGLILGGGVATAVGVHPTWCCTPPLGVLHAGLGREGVGDCRGAVVDQRDAPFGVLGILVKGGDHVLSQRASCLSSLFVNY